MWIQYLNSLIFIAIHTLVAKFCLRLLHSERPKLYAILAFLSTIGLIHLIMQKFPCTLETDPVTCSP